MTEPQAPLFILGAPFSGAAYLAAQLGQHPQLYALPELRLFMADSLEELLNIFELSQGPQVDGLLRAVAQIEFGSQSDAGIEAARDWLKRNVHWSVGELLHELAVRVAPSRLVIPDAESPLRPMDLRRLQRHVPGAQVVHLLRHPWTQGCLLSAWARERLFVPMDYKDHGWKPLIIDPQIPWLRANDNIERAFPQPLQRLWIEALDVDPLAVRTALCRSLKLPTSDAALNAMSRPEAWLFDGLGPRSAPYGLEPDAFENFKQADLELAAQACLDMPLPWRPDSNGFEPEVLEMARRYGLS